MKADMIKQSVTILTTVFLLFILLACKKPDDAILNNAQEDDLLNEFFIERGSDTDSTYISLRGIRTTNDSLRILATSWGVVEFGLKLIPIYSTRAVLLVMIGKCGTVQTRTWKKVTFNYDISSEMADTLQQIGFTNSRDTLIVTRTNVKGI